MRPMPRRTVAIGACAAMILAALATEATTASASPSWQLVDQFTSQPACYTTSGGTDDLEVNLNGSWSTPITIGASGLPARFRRGNHHHRLLLRPRRQQLHAELRHGAHPGRLEQRDRAGQGGAAAGPAKLHARRGRLRGRHRAWPRGELLVHHHAVGQRRHHHANRSRAGPGQGLLQASLLNRRPEKPIKPANPSSRTDRALRPHRQQPLRSGRRAPRATARRSG